MNYDSKTSISTMKHIISAIVSVLLCLAGSASAQEHFLEIIRAEQNQKGIARGETIPGVVVNKDKDVKVGRKLNVGDRVSVPKDVRVTFESSNRNTVETKSNAEFIVSNIANKGEAYYQLFGKIRYVVIPKAVEFFNVYHTKYLAAVEGTVFVINVDLENKEIEFTAEQGDVSIIRSYNVKIGDKEIEQKERRMISSRSEKLRQLKYVLEFDENKFKSYKEAVETYFKSYKTEQKNISNSIPAVRKHDRNSNQIKEQNSSDTIPDSKQKDKYNSLIKAGFIEADGNYAVTEQNYKAAIISYEEALGIYMQCLEENDPRLESIKKKIEEVKEKMNRN